MKIKYSKRFLNEIESIVDFIASGNLSQANIFYNDLIQKLNNLSYMPYKFRQSTTSDDPNIRDFIYKKYIIPYKVEKETIIILGIYRENIWQYS